MASLYEIDQRLQALEEYLVDLDTGEIVDTEDRFNELFDEIQMDLSTKIEQTACFIKSLNAEVDAFKQEEKNLAERRKSKEKLAQRLQDNINNYIKAQFIIDDNGTIDTVALNKYKFETPKTKISYRKSDSVQILDQSKLPKEYIKTKIEETPNKTEIKQAIKNGKTIDGATIVTNYNMQIK